MKHLGFLQIFINSKNKINLLPLLCCTQEIKRNVMQTNIKWVAENSRPQVTEDAYPKQNIRKGN